MSRSRWSSTDADDAASERFDAGQGVSDFPRDRLAIVGEFHAIQQGAVALWHSGDGDGPARGAGGADQPVEQAGPERVDRADAGKADGKCAGAGSLAVMPDQAVERGGVRDRPRSRRGDRGEAVRGPAHSRRGTGDGDVKAGRLARPASANAGSPACRSRAAGCSACVRRACPRSPGWHRRRPARASAHGRWRPSRGGSGRGG